MPASDYPFDRTGTSPENLIVGEVHTTDSSVGVIPRHGPFYRDGLVVEGSLDGERYVVLTAMRDFTFSPLFLKPTSLTAKEIYSYVVIHGDWTHVRLRYQAVGKEDDVSLLRELTLTEFDRTDYRAWRKVGSGPIVDPSAYTEIWRGLGEAESVHMGVERLERAIQRLSPGGDRASNPTVTNLEIRLSEIEALFSEAYSLMLENNNSVNSASELFEDLKTQLADLELAYQGLGVDNLDMVNGHVYESSGALSTHVVQHDLGRSDLLVSVWEKSGGVYTLIEPQCTQLDNSRLQVNLNVAGDVLVHVRALSVAGVAIHSGVESSQHIIATELESPFTRVQAWWPNADGLLETKALDITMPEVGTYEVSYGEAFKPTVLVEPASNDDFIWRNLTKQGRVNIRHNLSSLLVAASVWHKDEYGRWVQNALPVRAIDLNTLQVDQNDHDVRVIVHSGRIGLNGTITDVQQGIAILTDEVRSILEEIADIKKAISSGIVVRDREHIYSTLVPKTEHYITHSLNEKFLDVACWTLNEDGGWTQLYLDYKPINNNNILISLLRPAPLRVRVRGEDSL